VEKLLNLLEIFSINYQKCVSYDLILSSVCVCMWNVYHTVFAMLSMYVVV